MEKKNTAAENYVVLDVETNGLSSESDDLLSISFYMPDKDKIYERFLPLELNSAVKTTKINGIRVSDLRGKKPLTQDEIDAWFDELELSRRTILHYGSIDEKFLRRYFKNHQLEGFNKLHFYNFKKQICSSSFSDGSITKDNLCKMFGIEGVTTIHSASNDCILEWKLFEKIAGRTLLITELNMKEYGVFALGDDYLVPVSYLQSYPNLSKIVDRPKIECGSKELIRVKLSGNDIKRLPANGSGLTLEHLIDVMLDVKELDPLPDLIANKKKLEFLGKITKNQESIPLIFNSDGSVSPVNEKDRKIASEINKTQNAFKKKMSSIIDFIKNDIFNGQEIMSHELIRNEDARILSVCDLSSSDAVLEIKTGPLGSESLERYKEQLFYESNGRKTYILGMEWNYLKPSVDIYIRQAMVSASSKISHAATTTNIGTIKLMKNGMKATVTEVDNRENLTVKFQDGLIRHGVRKSDFEKGQIPHREKRDNSGYFRTKFDWHNYVGLTEEEKNEKALKACFFGTFASDLKGKGNRIVFPYKHAFSFDNKPQRESDKYIKVFIQAIPEKLIDSDEIRQELINSLGLQDFFKFYPLQYLTEEVLEYIFEKNFMGQDYSIFPKDVVTEEFWKFVFEEKGMKKRKTRPHGFPISVWIKLKFNKE